MRKLIRFTIKFLIAWYFTLFFYDWLGLPIYKWLVEIQNGIITLGKFIVSGSNGSIYFDVFASIALLVVIIVAICVWAESGSSKGRQEVALKVQPEIYVKMAQALSI